MSAHKPGDFATQTCSEVCLHHEDFTWILSPSFLCLTPERNGNPPAKDTFHQFSAPQTEGRCGDQHGQDKLRATRVGMANGASEPQAELSPSTRGSLPAKKYLVFSIPLIQRSFYKQKMKPTGKCICSTTFKVSHLLSFLQAQKLEICISSRPPPKTLQQVVEDMGSPLVKKQPSS